MEAWCEAKLAMLSLGGTFVRPSMRVMMSDWEIPGSVYSMLSDAAAPKHALTPGQLSYGIKRVSSSSICSRTAPYMLGSPVCRRTVIFPSASAAFMTAMTSSSVIFALLYISQLSPA